FAGRPEAAELGLDTEPGGDLVRDVDRDARRRRGGALDQDWIAQVQGGPQGAGGGEVSDDAGRGIQHAPTIAGGHRYAPGAATPRASRRGSGPTPRAIVQASTRPPEPRPARRTPCTGGRAR